MTTARSFAPFILHIKSFPFATLPLHRKRALRPARSPSLSHYVSRSNTIWMRHVLLQRASPRVPNGTISPSQARSQTGPRITSSPLATTSVLRLSRSSESGLMLCTPIYHGPSFDANVTSTSGVTKAGIGASVVTPVGRGPPWVCDMRSLWCRGESLRRRMLAALQTAIPS